MSDISSAILQSYGTWGSVWMEPLKAEPNREMFVGEITPILERYLDV